MTKNPTKQLNKMIEKDIEDKYITALLNTTDEMIDKLKSTPKYSANQEYSCIVNILTKQQNLIKFMYRRITRK